jgi:macrolide-specific efflux system membrane fusion protein
MKRLLIAIAVLLVAGAGTTWYVRGATQSEAPATRTQAVALGDIQDLVSAVGTLQPRDYVDVGTQVSGQVQRIHVKIGSKVEKGELLAEIDPTVYQARVASDEATLVQLQAQLSEKRANLSLSERQFERQKALLAERATSRDAYDTAETQTSALRAQIRATEAQISQTQANLNANKANLSYTKISAPMTGTVVDITARLGQTLNANQSAPIILRIADLATMTVWTQVSEADVSRLELGQRAFFTTLGKPDRRREGKLHQILPTPTVTNNVVLYNSLFDVANPDGDLLPQMSAQVFFVIAEAQQVPVVPVGAVATVAGRDGRQQSFVRVMENGEAVRRRVELGATNRAIVEVKSGLKVGDQVVMDQVRRPAGQGQPGQGQQRPAGPPPRL